MASSTDSSRTRETGGGEESREHKMVLLSPLEDRVSILYLILNTPLYYIYKTTSTHTISTVISSSLQGALQGLTTLSFPFTHSNGAPLRHGRSHHDGILRTCTNRGLHASGRYLFPIHYHRRWSRHQHPPDIIIRCISAARTINFCIHFYTLLATSSDAGALLSIRLYPRNVTTYWNHSSTISTCVQYAGGRPKLLSDPEYVITAGHFSTHFYGTIPGTGGHTRILSCTAYANAAQLCLSQSSTTNCTS